MKKVIKLLFKYLFLLCTGGSIYYLIEILYRGYSHYSMFLVGGACFVIIGLLNEGMSWDLCIEKQVILGWISVLLVEFISGCILNLWLGLNIWDYSDLPFNILGQVCLPFALLWIPLIIIAILLDDSLRYSFFNEQKPKYVSHVVQKIKSLLNHN